MNRSKEISYLRPSILLLAVLCGLLVGACGFLVDFMVHNTQRLYASDLYTVLVACGFSYVLMIHQARSRANLLRRMEIAADVNHHIRNALTAVVYTAAVQHDPELEAVLKDATSRIDWVLSTVLPDGSEELQWPVQSASWKPSDWSRELHVQTPAANPVAQPAEPDNHFAETTHRTG